MAPPCYRRHRFPPEITGCGFRKETIAGMGRNGRDAPEADVQMVHKTNGRGPIETLGHA